MICRSRRMRGWFSRLLLGLECEGWKGLFHGEEGRVGGPVSEERTTMTWASGMTCAERLD